MEYYEIVSKLQGLAQEWADRNGFDVEYSNSASGASMSMYLTRDDGVSLRFSDHSKPGVVMDIDFKNYFWKDTRTDDDLMWAIGLEERSDMSDADLDSLYAKVEAFAKENGWIYDADGRYYAYDLNLDWDFNLERDMDALLKAKG